MKFLYVISLIAIISFSFSGCHPKSNSNPEPEVFIDYAPPELIASCSNAAKDGNETDIDCGGSCAKCQDEKSCVAAKDCQSSVCAAGICSAPSCQDEVKNSDETDIDCGGSCSGCLVGNSCQIDSDCQSGNCFNEVCVQCRSNADCNSGEVCEIGMCWESPNG